MLFVPQRAHDADRIGLGARLGTSGFAADGSIYAEAPKEDALEQRWNEMFARIEGGTGQFVKDCSVSEAALDALGVFVDRMEGAGNRVVLLLAPLPGAIIERLAAERRYAYVDELRGALTARYPHRFHDFLDMRDNAPDSEFLDGIHGGEVVYMRAVLAAARRSGSPLREFVDENYLATQIDLWHGRAQIADEPIHQRFFR